MRRAATIALLILLTPATFAPLAGCKASGDKPAASPNANTLYNRLGIDVGRARRNGAARVASAVGRGAMRGVCSGRRADRGAPARAWCTADRGRPR
jgi:hypothetical protein